MKTLIIATKNKNKLKELKTLLRGLPLRILGLDQLDRTIPDVKEDKKTFIGNARKKALAISRIFKDAIVIADDSGLVVKCLNGAPGVRSARYVGRSQNNEKNIKKLFKNMQNAKNRSAYFNCTAVIAVANKVVGIAEERVYGRILREKRGFNGFGYDPIFVPNGYKKSFAQMSASFKNRISHRAKALKKARLKLKLLV